MLKRMMSIAAAVALSGSLAATPATAQDPSEDGADKLVSAFTVDADGNVNAVDSVNIDGKSVKVGDAVQAGLVDNGSSDSLVLALAEGGLVTIGAKSKAFLEIAQAAKKVRVCRCNCGNLRETYSPTTEADCTALNGQHCENPAGTVRELSKCLMTWVSEASAMAEVASSEALKP